MNRILALLERDLRKFFRSPMLMVASLALPLIQLVILGYAFGGKIKNLKVGVVDQDHRLPAVKLHAMMLAIAANAKTFETVSYPDLGPAMRDLREGKISGVLNIPPHFSRDEASGTNPQVALIEDNTDEISTSALEGAFDGLIGAYNGTAVPSKISSQVALNVVEIYPYVPYIQFLLPGIIVLAIFVSVMIGGGIIFIDDKARGMHEGYLVTPINKFQLISGFTLSGTTKAIIAGVVLTVFGSVIARVPNPLDPGRLLRLMLVIVVSAVALNSMMFLMMVRVSDPLVPRATFGVLNTLLWFPSGAVYPVAGFPKWMQAYVKIDPFTYAVDAFKALLLKNTGFAAIGWDLLFLVVFSTVMLVSATALFRRTL